MQTHPNRGALLALCLVFLVIVQQVTCNPVPWSDTPSAEIVSVQTELKRSARMTPLWRIMLLFKPHALCQNNYACSTGLCRYGHCSALQTILS
uniref:LEAP-2 n=1 Tax=Chanodichthys ilishaeformis TaxID=291482 RepID=A0A7T5V7W0_9TELE|nr:LEAP-2 precursor [Chanodichthys ilishaeformis]